MTVQDQLQTKERAILPDPIDWRSLARPYQVNVVGNTLKWKYKSVMVVSPAGSGKTFMGLATAHDWFHDESPERTIPKENRRVVWMAMRRELLDQAQLENSKFGFNLPITTDQFDPGVTIQSAFTLFKGRAIAGGEEFEYLLISDEAHHVACETLVDNIGAIEPEYHVGLSATPFRADHASLGFEAAITESGYNNLIRLGFLSGYDHYQIDEWSPECVTMTFLLDPEGWGKTLMFFKNSDECIRALTALLDAGIRAEFVRADSDRDNQIKNYKYGDVQVLIAIQLLTEGFDAPMTKSVFSRDTCSKSLQIQMSGRSLRLWNEGTEEEPRMMHKRVVQSKQAKYLFSSTAEPTHRFVQLGDGSWEDATAITHYFKSQVVDQDAIQKAVISRKSKQLLVLKRQTFKL